MKLRQKLAMVLAASMVITAVPVVTFADSTNKVINTAAAYDGAIVKHDAPIKLVLDIDDSNGTTKTTFYVNAKDFKFSETEYSNMKFANTNKTAVKDQFTSVLATLNKEELGKELGETIVSLGDVTDITLDGTSVKSIDVKAVVKKATKLADGEAEKTLTIKANVLSKFTALDKIVTATNESLKGGVYIVLDGNGGMDASTSSAIKASTYVNGTQVTILYEDSDRIRVTVTAATGKTNLDATRIAVPILGEVKSGSPVIEVEDLDAVVSSGKYFITSEKVTDDKPLVAKFGDVKNITVDGGEIGEITIAERKQNFLSGVVDKGETKDDYVYFTLPKNSDLVFSPKQEITIKGIRAFAPTKVEGKAVEYAFIDADGKNNEQVIRIKYPKPGTGSVNTTAGEWNISGISIEPENARDEAREGDVKIKVTGENIKEVTEKVAVVTEYAIGYKCEKPVDLVAGKGSKEVVVELKENVKDSLDDKRWATFELSEGAYIKADAEYKTNANIKDAVTIKVNGDKIQDIAGASYDVTNVIKNVDGDIIGFKVEFDYKDGDKDKEGYLDQKKANKIEFVFNVQAATSTKGDVTLKAESRAFKVEPIKVATVTAPIEVKFDETNVKVGLEKQQGGKITIKETAADMLEKGLLYIQLDDAKFATKRQDIKLNIPKESTLKVEVKEVKNGLLTLEVTRQSKEATTFTIEGLTYTVNRAIPEGEIDADVYGSALRNFDGVWADTCANGAYNHGSANTVFLKNDKACYEEAEHRIKVEGLIKVPTKNTEDLNGAGKAVEAKFVIGSNKYTVNAEEKTMDAAAFAKDGRTMIPVRFLCEALGLPGDALTYSGKNITIITNNRAIGLSAGSKTMLVDGVPVQMTAATLVKDNRTYAPVSEIARALGLASNWDAATQTATFTK